MDRDTVRAALGYVPPQEILIVGCRGALVNHCLVGRLTLHLARQFDGGISLYGQLEPLGRRRDSSVEEARAFMAASPGAAWELYGCDPPRPDGTPDGPDCLVDVAFLAVWLDRPDFYLLERPRGAGAARPPRRRLASSMGRPVQVWAALAAETNVRGSMRSRYSRPAR